MRRDHELEVDVIYQHGSESTHRTQNRTLPSRVEMTLHLIDKHDQLPGGLVTAQIRGDLVLAPGPGQHVGERDDPADARRCVNDWHLAGVWRLDGRNVARIVDGQTHGQTGRDCMAFGRLTGSCWRGQLEQGQSHAYGVLVLGLDPPGPVVQQAVADRGQAPVHGIPEPVPYLRFGEHIRRPTLLGSDITGLAPIVPGGIPHRERAVGVRVDDYPGKRGASGFADPALLPP